MSFSQKPGQREIPYDNANEILRFLQSGQFPKFVQLTDGSMIRVKIGHPSDESSNGVFQDLRFTSTGIIVGIPYEDFMHEC